MAVPNVPFNQLPKEAQRRIRRENPDEFPLKDTRPSRDVDVYRDTTGSKPQPKSRWESIREGILKGGDKVKEGAEKGYGKAQKFAQNHPINNPPDAHRSPKKEPNKANWREAKEPRGRVSQRDIYKDGVLVEKVHYGPAHPPAQKQPKRRGRREDPLGGIGVGMKMSDFLPSNSGFGLGGMMSEPYGAPAPRPRKKKGRRQPQERADFDFIEHMNSMPDSWKGLF